MNAIKGFYLYPGSKKIFSGVEKKIGYQIQYLSEYFDMTKVVIEKENTDIIKSLLWRLPGGSWGGKYDDSFDDIINNITDKNDRVFFYIRKSPLDYKYVQFIKKIKTTFPNSKVVLEIPTYPYDKELMSSKTMWPWFFKDIFFRKEIRKYIDRIITYSNDGFIFGVKTINVINGICVDEISKNVIETNKKDNTINLLSVAQFQKSHGYERIIRGIADYYKGNPECKVLFHMVGYGEEEKYYKSLVRKLGVEKCILFYGQKSGEELERIYEIADIGMGCFGLYKRKIDKSSALKTREYLAHGLPVVSGAHEDAFDKEKTNFFLEFQNDNSEVSIDNIVMFYKGLLKNVTKNELKHQIINYAKRNVDMKIVMNDIIDYILD